MKTITYLYDVDDWALHNVGKSVVEHLGTDNECSIVMMEQRRFFQAPFKSDTIWIAYIGLADPDFPFEDYCSQLILTIHDPSEISNFTDRADWAAHPLVPTNTSRFTRVGVTSRELADLFRNRYGLVVDLVPTYPHTAGEFSSRARRKDHQGATRFVSSTIGSDRYTMRQVVGRLSMLNRYLRDEKGAISIAQLRGIAVVRKRKNLRLLREIEAALLLRNADVSFNALGAKVRSYSEYADALSEADVYVCTSFMEGGPLPVMEAVLCGLAVIATNVGQVSEWVEHGTNGFICQGKDEFLAAADAYLSNEELLRSHQAQSLLIAQKKRFAAAPWRAFLLGDHS